jgi:hypothetical protein
MPKPSKSGIDPVTIWAHADCFYQALHTLHNSTRDPQIAIMLAQPSMVMGAFTIELFFKCLICLETGEVPHCHDLRELYDKLSLSTQSRIMEGWDKIAAHRASEWDNFEKDAGLTIARDLPSALTAGSKAFEQIRYGYEQFDGELQYYLQDLPNLLGYILLQMKPEWEGKRRMAVPVQSARP